MPITKIPIVHKFGIISHTQRLELQERLLKQSYIQTLKSQKALAPTRNPLEVSEEFVQKYNEAKDLTERESLEQTGQKMLERAKRRAGVKDGGEGKYVNLPMAWTELAQLAQCRGKIQEECLDVLIVSLDQSPLEKYHIPALFFLAETMLYWLRTDAVHQPYLRTGEIKLLKMGQLVFARLFYHHMAGQLAGQKEFKNRLFTYLDGLQECQEAYSPYPNALLSLRFIITVGKIIMSDTQLEPGEIKEGDNIRKSALSRPSAKSNETSKLTDTTKELSNKHTPHSVAISSSVHDLSPTLWHALDVWRCTNHLSGGLSEALKALSHCGMGLVNESWVDSMIALQILAEAAKSSLSAMRTLHNMARGFRIKEASQTPPGSSRSESSAELEEPRIDISEQKLKQEFVEEDLSSVDDEPEPPKVKKVLRFDITWSSAKFSSQIAGGILKSYSFSSEESTPRKGRESHASLASSKPTLSDIYERSEEGDSEKRPDTSNKTNTGTDSKEPNNFISPGMESSSMSIDAGNTKPSTSEATTSGKQREKATPREPSGKREVSFDADAAVTTEKASEPIRRGTPKSTGQRLPTQGSRATGDTLLAPGTGFQAEVGSDLPSGRASDASTVQTYTNTVNPTVPGINGWHWEVAITYTDILADICLHGSTAEIQKMALMGTNKDTADPFKRGQGTILLASAGLLDLAFFKAINETVDGGPNDWSWRIRFGAVQSMVKVCRCLVNDKNREGIRTAAWNVLLRAHSMEKDDRVLEALKVGQGIFLTVHTDTEKLLNKQLSLCPSTIGSKIAGGLSIIYLPPLPPPVEPYVPSRKKEPTLSPEKIQSLSQESVPQPKQEIIKARTSLKEEIMLATALYEPPVSYTSRTSFDLRRIVEDQWRKDLQKQMEDEEKERQKALKERQKEEEDFQRQMAQKKAQKISKPAKETSSSVIEAK